MMLTSKERAALRAQANKLETIFQIGKGGVGDNLIAQVDGALNTRELIKLRVLESSMLSAGEAAEMLAEATGADVVQSIGSRFVLYRPRPEEEKEQPEAPKRQARYSVPVHRKAFTRLRDADRGGPRSSRGTAGRTGERRGTYSAGAGKSGGKSGRGKVFAR